MDVVKKNRRKRGAPEEARGGERDRDAHGGKLT